MYFVCVYAPNSRTRCMPNKCDGTSCIAKRERKSNVYAAAIWLAVAGADRCRRSIGRLWSSGEFVIVAATTA